MKVVLKTITGKQHEVTVDASATTLDVKRLLEDEYEPASLRLCFNGAVLEDSKTLADSGVKDSDSLVLAGRKRKIPKPQAPPQAPAPAETPKAETPAESSAPASSTAAPQPAAPAPASAAAPAVPSAPVVPAAVAASAPPPAPAAAATPAPTAPSAANTYGVAPHLIDEVASMGFEDRRQIALALRAAFMNVERAVEYLFDGIPPQLVEELTRHDAAAAAPAHPPASAPETSASAAVAAPPPPESAAPASTVAAQRTPESDMRAALSRIPQFDEIRALYNQNTDTLPVVMQQIALRHPAVYEQIERDPETFLSIMSEVGQSGTTGAPSASTAPSSALAVAGEGAEEHSFMTRLPAAMAGRGEVQLTAEDNVAVQQLVDIGGGMWDEQSAVLVYLASDRNQEMAASILFEHGGVPAELLVEIADLMDAEGDNEEGEEEGEYDDA
ncbi:UV excision repair RAD23-like protein [Novymonas esmeraldas]|uniref:UV excision repair protein RAD23 n=1 Tax=Novymonas esmeraldas TaxID=1808958 RepID=A0AAW0EQ42_9TRYP